MRDETDGRGDDAEEAAREPASGGTGAHDESGGRVDGPAGGSGWWDPYLLGEPPSPPLAVSRSFWPSEDDPAPWPVLVGVALTAVLAGAFCAASGFGANVLVVALAATGTAIVAGRAGGRRGRPGWWRGGFALLGLFLAAVPLWRGDDGFGYLTVVAAFAAAALALGGGRRWAQVARQPLVVIARFPGGAEWVSQGVSALVARRRGGTGAAMRAVAATAALGGVFVGLFAAADAVFADLLGGLAPDEGVGPVLLRVLFAVFGTALAATAAWTAYDRRDRQREDTEPERAGYRVGSRIEWLLPLAVLDVLFLGFVVIQAVVLFGHQDGLLDDVETSRAAYARDGFWQLMTVTVLTLAVVAVTMTVVPRERAADRRLAKRLVGVLALLAVGVGAAALYRTASYVGDFGLDRVRLVTAGAEVWLCAVLLMVVLATLVRGVTAALPRITAAGALVTVAVLGAVSPDAMVADQRVRLYERTGAIDLDYVRGLGPDAVPALDRLPEPYRSCALADIAADLDEGHPWYATSLAEVRAERILRDRPVKPKWNCPSAVSSEPGERR
ncbi:DUF4173 domain-containing protein [Yinghuangia seranimata]|uniref:DUF4153 domain-containing protein n=1 Tax=Yinghuangia seranimata TaxID=408067 RepID=UPI00248C435F|nr:DUF4173 domain-containing protein [Yinghuangia seranimata]MDI2132692.1 DUF4173 domain-containing protein [Yinghuangia seranimata]